MKENNSDDDRTASNQAESNSSSTESAVQYIVIEANWGETNTQLDRLRQSQ